MRKNGGKGGGSNKNITGFGNAIVHDRQKI